MYRNVTKSCNWDYRLRARATTHHMHACMHITDSNNYSRFRSFSPSSSCYTYISSVSLWLLANAQLLLPFPFLYAPVLLSHFFPNSTFRPINSDCSRFSLFCSMHFFFPISFANAHMWYACVLGPTAWDRIALRLIQILYLIAPSKFVRPMLSHEICVNEMAAERIVQIWHKFSNLTIKRQKHGKQNNNQKKTEREKELNETDANSGQILSRMLRLTTFLFREQRLITSISLILRSMLKIESTRVRYFAG